MGLYYTQGVRFAQTLVEHWNGSAWAHVSSPNPMLSGRQIMGGYPCGGPGDPCDRQNRPYFRPAYDITRGQVSRIVANTFYPNCQTPWQ